MLIGRLGYESKKGVKDDSTYFDLSNWKKKLFTEMEKEQSWGSTGCPMGDVK